MREVSSLFLQGISEVILKHMYVNEFVEALVSRTLPNLKKTFAQGYGFTYDSVCQHVQCLWLITPEH